MLASLLLVAFVAGTHGLSADVTAQDVNAGIEDANAYVDSVIEFELPRRMKTLDPLTRHNFQPINGNHRDLSVRFVSVNMTGFRQIRRDGDCQLIRAVGEHPTTLLCNLLTDLHYVVVVNITYMDSKVRNVRISGTFYGVKGPLIVTVKKSLPVKVEFSPRYDAMENSVARQAPRPKWYKKMENEFYLSMIHLFEYATRNVFATEMFRAAKDFPLTE